MRAASAVAIVLMGLTGCQAKTETAEQMQARMQSEETAFRAVIDTLTPAFANHLNQGHTDIVAAYYTDDANIMAPNMPAEKGIEGAKKILGEFVSMKAQLTLTPVTVSVNGPLGVEQGTYSVSFTPPGAPAPMTDKGKYLVQYRKVGDKWLLANDIWNSDMPMPMAPTAPPAPPRR